MPDRQAYNASTIDWPRIRAYARRVARETRTPAENGIFYTTTEYQTVTNQVEVKHGLFNLFTRVDNKSMQVTVEERVDVVGRATGCWSDAITTSNATPRSAPTPTRRPPTSSIIWFCSRTAASMAGASRPGVIASLVRSCSTTSKGVGLTKALKCLLPG